ncbi:MAG: 3-hydroxyacyl-CoA dehydrogenase family protein [Thaumarchaeota archaeon]|nr:3-hydroxyacyl-CoA dehydrogenase family protein [Nitrososphaerota archaeon]
MKNQLTKADSPKKITVIGFGLMGAQISQVISLAGYRVLAYDVDSKRLQSGLSLIRSGKYGLENSVRNNRISKESAENALSKISTSESLEDVLSGADFILEAVVEDLDTKRGIFLKASQIASKEAVLASNTSTISITKIAAVLDPASKKRLVGMHFFNPPQIMKLVEIVRTEDTGVEIIEKVREVAVELGKTPVTVLDYPGFVANRIGISVFMEASDILSKGIASVRDIDISMRLGYGYPMGPFELGDLVGLDSRLRNMEALYDETKEERFKPPELLRKLVSEGYLGDRGSKTESKGGYYEYFGLERPSKEIGK